MGLLAEIAGHWRAPGASVRARLAEGVREDRALARLAGGCLALFVAGWPAAFRAAAEDPSVPLEARLAGALLGTCFLAPLGFYALAGLSHLAARAFGGAGSWHGARVALFSALLAVSPLVLGQGIVAGIAGPGRLATATGLAVAAAFLWLWLAGLGAAEDERV